MGDIMFTVFILSMMEYKLIIFILSGLIVYAYDLKLVVQPMESFF